MGETDQVQVKTDPNTSDSEKRPFYAPWMIGVLVIFAICECCFWAWGVGALGILGLLVALLFSSLRYCIVRTSFLGLFAVAISVLMLVGFFYIISRCTFLSDRIGYYICTNNLKQVGLALHNIHDARGQFPPAFMADEAGQPMHSWRTLVLPFLEQNHLYQAYDFKQPWNSPKNQAVIAESRFSGETMQCPSIDNLGCSKDRADYVAVTGADTIWPADGTSRSLKDITVDPSNVAMLIEINNSDIQWSEPRDIKLEDLLSGKVSWSETGMHIFHGVWDYPVPGRNVLFADASVRYIRGDLTPD